MRVTRSLEVPDAELELRFSRSGGPGGQNVNRRATKVELVFDVAGSPSLGVRQRARLLAALATRIDGEGRLHVVAQERRTQLENRERVLERFRTLVARALAPPPKARIATKPSRGATERRIRQKKARGVRKRQRARPRVEE